jgi:short-subunit dehydrogenase
VKDPKVIVLTGASGGLGQALARELAAPGRHFLLAGRDVARLIRLCEQVETMGASAELLTLPVEDLDGFGSALTAFDARHPIDLLVVNAGVKTGNHQGEEPPLETARVMAVNLMAPLAQVQAVLPAMKARGRGQIALVSSLAALSPHADLLSYSATKAAVRAYGIALRRALGGTAISVSIVTPGFIATPMTERHKGATPLLMSPERAARLIAKGLARSRAFITFPKILAVLVALENLLPAWLGDRIDSLTRAEIEPDGDEVSHRLAQTQAP